MGQISSSNHYLYAVGIVPKTADFPVSVSKDYGITWYTTQDSLTATSEIRFPLFVEVHPFNPEIAFAACGNTTNFDCSQSGYIWRTTDAGIHWKTAYDCPCTGMLL